MDMMIIVFGVILILLSIMVKLLLEITKSNNTIDILYVDNSHRRDNRYKLEKIKCIFSILFFIMGIITIAIGLFGLH